MSIKSTIKILKVIEYAHTAAILPNNPIFLRGTFNIDWQEKLYQNKLYFFSLKTLFLKDLNQYNRKHLCHAILTRQMC